MGWEGEREREKGSRNGIGEGTEEIEWHMEGRGRGAKGRQTARSFGGGAGESRFADLFVDVEDGWGLEEACGDWPSSWSEPIRLLGLRPCRPSSARLRSSSSTAKLASW